MKKLSLLLVALAIAVTASAAVNFNGRGVSKKMNRMLPPTAKVEKQNPAQRFGLPADHPAGELKTYLRGGEALYYSYGVYNAEQDGKVYVVFAEDGETVYIMDPVYGLSMNAWVEGKLVENNLISVAMGQSLGYEEDWWYGDIYEYALVWGSTYFYDSDEIDEETGKPARYIDLEVDERATEAFFEIDGDVLRLLDSDGDISLEGEDGFIGTGLAAVYSNYNNAWTGNIDWKTTYTLTENYQPVEMITEQPEGELVQYYRSCGSIYYGWGWGIGNLSGKVNVVWGDDGAVYIQDILGYYTFGTWVKGTYNPDNSTITFPLGQYVYEDMESETAAYLTWARMDVDEEGYLTEIKIDDVTEVTFAFDAENGVLTMLGSEGNPQFDEDGYLITPDSFTGLALWIDGDGIYELDFNTVLREHIDPATPADPTDVYWSDYGDEDGYNSLRFTLPTTDIDGNPLMAELISYSVYLDNGNGPELFTFTTDEYGYDLDEDMTEIPYEIYSNAYDFYSGSVYFYHTFEGLVDGYDPLFTHNIGIQVFYTAGGEKRASNIVWAFDPNTAVNEVNAGKTVANVRYFNVAGQEMAQPEGMTIQVTTYTDGTTSAVKVVK